MDGEEKERILELFREEYGAIGYSMVSLVGRLRGEREMTSVISITFGRVQVDGPTGPTMEP